MASSNNGGSSECSEISSSSSSTISTANSSIEFLPDGATAIKWVPFDNICSAVREAYVHTYVQSRWPDDPAAKLVTDIRFDPKKGSFAFSMNLALGDLANYMMCPKLREIINGGGGGYHISVEYILYSVLLTLHRLHSGGILHRDVKPGNILLVRASPDDPFAEHGVSIVLADYGNSSVVYGRDASRKQYTCQICTRRYAPPEDKSGLNTGYSFDIFSAAAMTIDYITDHSLQKPASVAAARSIRDAAWYRRPPKHPEEFAVILEAMLSPNPAARPSAWDLLQHPYFSEYRYMLRHNDCPMPPPPPGPSSDDIIMDDAPPPSPPQEEEGTLGHLLAHCVQEISLNATTHATALAVIRLVAKQYPGLLAKQKKQRSNFSGSGCGGSGFVRMSYYITKKQAQWFVAILLLVSMYTECEPCDYDHTVYLVARYMDTYNPSGLYKKPNSTAFSFATCSQLVIRILQVELRYTVPLVHGKTDYYM